MSFFSFRSNYPIVVVPVLIGLSIITDQSFGQDLLHIKFENISVRDGLSQFTPNCIFQDSKGLLWIGTEDGLNKYNGYEFEIYKPEINDPASISFAKVKCIEEDLDGNLWIGTNGGGLNKYDRNYNSFIRFKANDQDSASIPGDVVTAVKCMNNGSIWVGTDKGLRIINNKNHTFFYPGFLEKESLRLQDEKIAVILADANGIIWIGAETGLYSVDTARGFVATYMHDPFNAASLPADRITCLYSDRYNNLWIGTERGLVIKNSGTDIFQRSQPGTASSIYEIKDFLEDRKGNIWIATFGGGMDIFTQESGKIISLTFDYNNPYSVSHNEVSCLCLDRTGIIWAGTYGLDKYNPNREKFKLYDYIPNTKENISFKSIYSIYEDRYKVLWIGSKTEGLHVFDRDNNEYYRIKHEEINSNSLSGNMVRVIRENPDGVFWIGTENGGLNKVILDDARRPRQFIHYKHDPLDSNTLTSNLVYSLYFDAEDNLWIGTDNGLNRMEIETGIIKHYLPDSANPNSLSNTTAYYIYGDATGTMWIATDYGINQYNPETDDFIHYVHDDKDTNSLIINEILTICEDREGMLWIGTFSGGLDRFDRKTKRFTHFNTVKELSNAVIYGIFEDVKSNLWMSTNNGIMQFNPKTKFLKQFTIDDGLQSNEFNGGAYFRSPDGELFFGGYFGFNTFFPEKIKLDTIAPAIILTDLQVKNVSVQPGKKSPIKKHISVTDEIILNHNQNNFTLYFAALHFANPQQNKYRYQLEGFDKGWIDAGNKRFVSFTSLPYRKYKLRIQAANCDGKWNEEGISVKIRIKPPLTGTVWFRILMIGLVAGGIIYALRYRMKREQKQKSLLEERVRESTHELEIAREKLDKQKEEIIIQKQELKLRERDQEELLWFNQGISTFSELISKNKSDIKMLSEQLIMKLIEYVEAQQGGIFLLNDDDEDNVYLELVGHHAFNIEKLNNRFLPGEGYVGTCFVDKEFIEIDDLPEGYAVLRSGLGEEQLKHLVLAPLKVNEISVGVMEIASFRKIKGYKVAFIEKLSETFASAIATEKSNIKLKRLIEQTRKQAAELQEREEELRQNLEEMQATQEESIRREDELIKYAEEAASREEILNQKIAELEAKIKSLTEKGKSKKKEG
ncbi:MAG: GAF domain-containing protein [Bacteroidales bacterium]|nr:GAF domain-containing protein [Bacteroidales bacterium]